jgi:hypothetical protein
VRVCGRRRKPPLKFNAPFRTRPAQRSGRGSESGVTDTGAIRTTTSGPDGVYVLPNLPIGFYRLEIGKQGFNTYVQTGIVLQVATNPAVDVTLRVGAVSEQVEVEANAAPVDRPRASGR